MCYKPCPEHLLPLSKQQPPSLLARTFYAGQTMARMLLPVICNGNLAVLTIIMHHPHGSGSQFITTPQIKHIPSTFTIIWHLYLGTSTLTIG